MNEASITAYLKSERGAENTKAIPRKMLRAKLAVIPSAVLTVPFAQ
ncbi:MAG: hypothetical protein AB7K24_26200 [Gemmataceae bacterium]